MGQYMIYLSLIVIVALFYQGKFIYLLLYTLLLMYAALPRLIDYALSHLVIRRELSDNKIFYGDTTQIKLEVHNPTLVPLPFVMLHERVSPDLARPALFKHVSFIAPRGTTYYEYTVKGQRRGLHAIGPLLVEVGDPFDIHKRAGKMAKLDHLLVYPKVHSVADLGLPSRLPFGAVKTKQRIFEDPSQMIGVRSYAAGDPLKRIHWKVSARVGTLQVKQYQPTIALETMLLVNMNTDEYANYARWQTEQAIEVAASLANELYRKGQTIGLLSNGSIIAMGEADGDVVIRLEDRPALDEESQADSPLQGVCIRPGKGTLHFIRVLELLARLQPQSDVPFVDFIARQNTGLSWGATLIIVTYRDTKELISVAYRLRKNGFNVVIVVIGKNIEHRQLALGKGIAIYQAALGGQDHVISWSS